MVATTDVYKFRTPELGELADGPQAFRNLAEDVEKSMTVARSLTAFREMANGKLDGELANPGGNYTLMASRPVTLAAIGWADISITSTLVQSSFDQATNWAGNITAYVNGALIGSYRYHSHNVTRHVVAPLFAQIAVPRSMSSFVLQAVFSLDSASLSPVRAFEVDCNVVQYGAPRPTV